MRWILRSMVLWVAACDSGKPPEPQAAPAPAPEPTESRHALGTRDYPEVKTEPAGPLTIRFDFSGQRIYAFDYYQEVANTTDMGSSPKKMEQTMTAEGALLMKSKG